MVFEHFLLKFCVFSPILTHTAAIALRLPVYVLVKVKTDQLGI